MRKRVSLNVWTLNFPLSPFTCRWWEKETGQEGDFFQAGVTCICVLWIVVIVVSLGIPYGTWDTTSSYLISSDLFVTFLSFFSFLFSSLMKIHEVVKVERWWSNIISIPLDVTIIKTHYPHWKDKRNNKVQCLSSSAFRVEHKHVHFGRRDEVSFRF